MNFPLSTFHFPLLIAFGALHAGAAAAGLRGLLITGTRRWWGLAFGLAVLAMGVAMALGQALGDVALNIVLALPVALVLLAVGGAIGNVGHDPTREVFSPHNDAAWTAESVRIPIHLPNQPSAHAEAVHLFTGRGETDTGVPDFVQCLNPARGIQPDQSAIATPQPHAIPATLLRPKVEARGAHERGAHERGAVMLICGAGDNRFAFKWVLIRALLARGLAVLAYDPPGHGEFMDAPMTVANAQSVARAVLDWMCRKFPALRVGAIGISFGGCQASWLSANDARIAALALICTPARLPAITRKTIVKEAIGLSLPRNVLLLREASLPVLWREWQRLKGAWYGEDLHGMIAALDSADCIRRVGERPTFILHGSRDVAVPVSNAHVLHEHALPSKHIVVARQATHLSVVLYRREVEQLADWMATSLGA